VGWSRCFGLDGADYVFVGQPRIPALEGRSQRSVECLGAGLQEKMRAAPGPLHLLLFGEPLAHYGVDGRLVARQSGWKRVPGLDAQALPVRRGRPGGPNFQMRRRICPSLPLRGRRRAADQSGALVAVESLGCPADEADRRHKGQGGGRSQVGRHPALHLDGWH
jgi:hypothetical protein